MINEEELKLIEEMCFLHIQDIIYKKKHNRIITLNDQMVLNTDLSTLNLIRQIREKMEK